MSGDEKKFAWDEAKRQATLAKHGIDFVRATRIFLSPHLELAARSDFEERRTAIGDVEGTVIAVIFTRRGDAIRIITARRARRHEREDFRSLHDGSDSPDGGQD